MAPSISPPFWLVRGSRIAWMWSALLASQLACAQSALNSGDALVEQRETRAWLGRIQEAANKRTYQGTVIFSSGGTVASSRISHFYEGRKQLERIDALDGQARHVVRQNDQVHTIWPKRRVAMVEPRDQMSSFPALLHPGGESIPNFYELKAAGLERVAGRESQMLTLRAKDAYRYGYRLWADKSTGLLLRVEVLGGSGQVLESSSFSDVSIGVPFPSDQLLQPLKKLEGFRVAHSAVALVKLESEGWVLNAKVPGFQQVSSIRRPTDSPLREATPSGDALTTLQVTYSDGLTYVTVFIEPYRADRHPHAMQTAIGATQTLMRRHGEWWVTFMGDVPAPTLRMFADALQRSKP